MSAATQKERRREQRVQARRAILDASEALLLEQGYERFSIRKLVDRCGYTAPTIYHHFGDKDGLLDALLEERFAFLGRRMRRLASSERGDPQGFLRAVARAFVRFGLRYPRHYQLLTVPRGPERPPPPTISETRTQLERAWVELWEAGRLNAGNVEAAAQSLWCLCHGLVSGRVQNPAGPWSKTLIDDSIDALLRGLIVPIQEKPSALRGSRPGSQRRRKEEK